MEPPHKGVAALAWPRGIGSRVMVMWRAKALGTTAGMTLFFAAYFWVLRHPVHPFSIVPETAVDRWIGFWPGALPLYFSLWIYVSLAPALLTDGRELASFGLASVAMSTIGLGIFLLLPTAISPTPLDWSQHPGFGFLKSADASGNACPSLHVAFAVFAAASLESTLRRLGAGWAVRAFNILWCLGIVFSTMATRQHVFLDVLGGAGLGGAVAWSQGRYQRACA